MATFSDRLNEALVLRDLSPAELSRITGIGEGAISQYRKGAYKAGQRNLEKISSALQISVQWLMGVSDNITPSSQNKNQLPAIAGEELSEDQRYLIDIIRNASDDTVHRLRIIIDQIPLEKGQ